MKISKETLKQFFENCKKLIKQLFKPKFMNKAADKLEEFSDMHQSALKPEMLYAAGGLLCVKGVYDVLKNGLSPGLFAGPALLFMAAMNNEKPFLNRAAETGAKVLRKISAGL